VVDRRPNFASLATGDLRRLLELRGKDALDLVAGECMTKNPRDNCWKRVCGDSAGTNGRKEDYVVGVVDGSGKLEASSICMIYGERK